MHEDFSKSGMILFMEIEILHWTINPHLVYLVSFITLLVSLFLLLFIWPLLRWLEVKKYQPHEKRKMEPKNIKSKNSNSRGLGVVEITEKEMRKYNTKKKHKGLREVIDELQQKDTDMKTEDSIIEFWRHNQSFFQSELNIHKILLLKMVTNANIKVEAYKLFSLESLMEIEDKLNSTQSGLKDFVDRKSNLYFTGQLSNNSIFKCLFDNSEKERYGHIYILPIKTGLEVKGILFLVKKNTEEPISPPLLKKLLSKTALTK